MSSAARSESKFMANEGSSVKDTKEQQKSSSNLSGCTITRKDNSTSVRISISGEPVEHFLFLHGNAADSDSLSNNGSCSGESEDHKEKAGSTTYHPETVPGCDNEKREKIRQKNEKKHQRQRERRAKELHDRCCGYFMSRKLEVLSQQLVAMGFSSDRATLALMLNDGKLEESLSWLFEGSSEEALKKDLTNGSNLRIDVSQELVQITTMESKYNSSKQEVERVVIACEGDLDKAEETLRMQKLEQPVTPPKQEQTTNLRHTIGPQGRATVTAQMSRNERDFNYSKEEDTLSTFSEGSRNLQLSSNLPNSVIDKNWLSKGSSSSLSYYMGLPMQVAPSSIKISSLCNNCGIEGRNNHLGVMKEPVTMIQRPISMNTRQSPVTMSSASSGVAGWYANNVLSDRTNTNGKLLNNQTIESMGGESLSSRQLYPQTQISISAASMGSDTLSLEQHYHKNQYMQHAHMSTLMEPSTARLGNIRSSRSTTSSSSPSLNVPSSLGLFSGWGSTGTFGSATRIDWDTGNMMSHCDYNSIDWSLESNTPSLKSSRVIPGKSGGMMLGFFSTSG